MLFSSSLLPLSLLGLDDGRASAQTIAVAVEQNALASTLGLSTGLDPLAHASAAPESTDETNGTASSIGSVVLAHDGLDSLGSLISVIEGNGADVVVEDVGLDDAVEEVAANESELAIDGGSGAADKVPLLSGVVRERGVGVLEEGDGD